MALWWKNALSFIVGLVVEPDWLSRLYPLPGQLVFCCCRNLGVLLQYHHSLRFFIQHPEVSKSEWTKVGSTSYPKACPSLQSALTRIEQVSSILLRSQPSSTGTSSSLSVLDVYGC